MATVATAHGPHHAEVDPNADYLHAEKGIASWLTTLDHKRIGLMYLALVLIAFTLGGVFALVVRLGPGKPLA